MNFIKRKLDNTGWLVGTYGLYFEFSCVACCMMLTREKNKEISFKLKNYLKIRKDPKTDLELEPPHSEKIDYLCKILFWAVKRKQNL